MFYHCLKHVPNTCESHGQYVIARTNGSPAISLKPFSKQFLLYQTTPRVLNLIKLLQSEASEDAKISLRFTCYIRKLFGFRRRALRVTIVPTQATSIGAIRRRATRKKMALSSIIAP